ncbi:hypothetical protein FPOAC1_007246 [Fusarium poae]|uniref:hypothetical protein n=1 Tax=Fusarium poae TaxID=36050 RepID=UPI001CE84987|nr:hypothetical protein FPOAC1_007246 [Fusarium poae]KAG8673927.1 hypothetical protein FPOAC1_007246 [Fusarium poae]
MSFSDDGAFAHGFDSFLLASSSPPLPADPPLADTTWTPSITEHPSSDGTLGPIGLYGEGLDLLQDYSDNFGLACIEQVNLVDTEQMTVDMPDELYIPTVLDTGISVQSFQNPDHISEDVPVVENSVEIEQLELGCLRSSSGAMTSNNGKRQTDAEPISHNTDPLNDPFLLARIVDLEAKIDELLEWKAQQTKRGTELKGMMDEILGLLHDHERRLDLDK